MKVKHYLIALFIFLGIDAVWLTQAAGFYQSQLGHLMAETPNLLAAGVFYLLYIAVLMYFVIEPAHTAGSVKAGFLRGALFGLVTYATYDLTNLATLRDWPLFVTVIDLTWGTILTATTAAVSVWVAKKLN